MQLKNPTLVIITLRTLAASREPLPDASSLQTPWRPSKSLFEPKRRLTGDFEVGLVLQGDRTNPAQRNGGKVLFLRLGFFFSGFARGTLESTEWGLLGLLNTQEASRSRSLQVSFHTETEHANTRNGN